MPCDSTVDLKGVTKNLVPHASGGGRIRTSMTPGEGERKNDSGEVGNGHLPKEGNEVK